MYNMYVAMPFLFQIWFCCDYYHLCYPNGWNSRTSFNFYNTPKICKVSNYKNINIVLQVCIKYVAM